MKAMKLQRLVTLTSSHADLGNIVKNVIKTPNLEPPCNSIVRVSLREFSSPLYCFLKIFVSQNKSTELFISEESSTLRQSRSIVLEGLTPRFSRNNYRKKPKLGKFIQNVQYHFYATTIL